MKQRPLFYRLHPGDQGGGRGGRGEGGGREGGRGGGRGGGREHCSCGKVCLSLLGTWEGQQGEGKRGQERGKTLTPRGSAA